MKNSNIPERDLFKAIENADAHGVSQALCQGGDPNAIQHSWPAIAMIAALGHSFCMENLLRGKPKLEARLASGSTAAMIASSHGHERCLEVLINAGADVDARDAEGRSVCYFALQGRSVRRCLSLLLAAGCNLDAEVRPGQSLAHMVSVVSIDGCEALFLSERVRRESIAIDAVALAGSRGVKFRI